MKKNKKQILEKNNLDLIMRAQRESLMKLWDNKEDQEWEDWYLKLRSKNKS